MCPVLLMVLSLALRTGHPPVMVGAHMVCNCPLKDSTSCHRNCRFPGRYSKGCHHWPKTLSSSSVDMALSFGIILVHSITFVLNTLLTILLLFIKQFL